MERQYFGRSLQSLHVHSAREVKGSHGDSLFSDLFRKTYVVGAHWKLKLKLPMSIPTTYVFMG